MGFNCLRLLEAFQVVYGLVNPILVKTFVILEVVMLVPQIRSGFWVIKQEIIVLLLDILKGVTAASLVLYIPSVLHGTELYINLQLLFGILAVFGHIFPIFANFNGGKGIATLFGMLIGIHYILAVACVALFVVVLLLTRYVSLSSILAAISFPFFAIYIFHRDEPLLIAFGVAAALMVVITHKKNIIRLLNGEESKANLFRNKS